MNEVNKMQNPVESAYEGLVSRIRSEEGGYLSQMLANWLNRRSALPDGLGLEPGEFQELLDHYLERVTLPFKAPSGLLLDESRLPERAELERFLGDSQLHPTRQERLWVKVLVAGLTGSDHLWQDMGFFSRTELSGFLLRFFPLMAKKNDKNMKWKKFIYKQLCEIEEVGYTCRSPSCEVCADYANCFETEPATEPEK